MPVLWVLLIVLALTVLGYVLGLQRAHAVSGGDTRTLHSRPIYYAFSVALYVCVPALLLMLIWTMFQPAAVRSIVAADPPLIAMVDGELPPRYMADVRRAAGTLERAVYEGAITSREAAGLRPEDRPTFDRMRAVGVPLLVTPGVLEGAKNYRAATRKGNNALATISLVLALGGLAFAYLRIKSEFRARNVVEQVVRGILILCSSIAIATTAGIVLSLIFESINFFQLYPWQDFFFGTSWVPRSAGGSDLGILPLLWGTLYISFIALLFAVPVGVLAAIYMSEYASQRVRSLVKPAIEVLAGIPTIVYGLFALATVGPLIRDWIARPAGFGESSASVLTAGVVMGIMLVPFVSSLSDDIINAVPQSLRDGSLGLGSTQSETIRKVVLPAALPGIVGAILLAASRAIGETMIVVLGAGAMAKISLNPFEAMTTITVKIVGQLHGDNDFISPETLVAFALGLTLFVITLALNIFALFIVRKYREQYE